MLRLRLRSMLLLFAVAPLVAWYWWQRPFERETTINVAPAEPPIGHQGSWPPPEYYRREVKGLRRGLNNTLIPHGPTRLYNRQGKLLREEHWRNGQRHGSHRELLADGEVVVEGTYVDGERHGDWKEVRRNGGASVQVHQQYHHGRPAGTWKEETRRGKPPKLVRRQTITYANGYTRGLHTEQLNSGKVVASQRSKFDSRGRLKELERWRRGTLRSRTTYSEEKRSKTVNFREDGEVVSEFHRQADRPVGVWKWWGLRPKPELTRTWTPLGGGRQLEARYIASTEDSVTVESANPLHPGRRFTVNLDRLIQADRDFVQRMRSERVRSDAVEKPVVVRELEFRDGQLVRVDQERLEPIGPPKIIKDQPITWRITATLQEGTQVDVRETGLDEVAQYLSDYHAVPVRLNAAALQRASIKTPKVTINNIEGVPLWVGLHLVLRNTPLTLVIRNEVIEITTKDDAERGDSTGITSLQVPPGTLADQLDWDTALEFANAPLKDALSFLAGRHGIVIVVADEARAAAERPVSFDVRGITLRSALTLLLRDADLRADLVDGKLVIRPVEPAAP